MNKEPKNNFEVLKKERKLQDVDATAYARRVAMYCSKCPISGTCSSFVTEKACRTRILKYLEKKPTT